MPLLPNPLTQENWLPLLETDDIDELRKYFGGFADSIITAYECWGETHIDEASCIVYPPEGPNTDQNILVTFHRQANQNASVQLLFTGIYEFHMLGRSEEFDGIINLMHIETNTSDRSTLNALSAPDGLEILTIDATALYWRPTPRAEISSHQMKKIFD